MPFREISTNELQTTNLFIEKGAKPKTIQTKSFEQPYLLISKLISLKL